jgi:predicted DNA-binding transcriptional regulator AlpA
MPTSTLSPSSVEPQNRYERRVDARAKRRAVAAAQTSYISPQGLLRLPAVLKLYPVGRTTWWNGVKSGKFPSPVRLGERLVAWKAADILALVEGALRPDQSS